MVQLDLAKRLECPEGHKVPIAPALYCDCMTPYGVSYSPRGLTRESIQAGPRNLFRYGELLPTNSRPDYDVGLTPLVLETRLGDALGFYRLYVKYDQGSETQTFKDRGVAVAAQLVSEFNSDGYNFRALGGTSTGNLASALSAGADRFGLKAIVLVHKDAEKELVAKAASFGSYILVVNAGYSQVSDITTMIIGESPSLEESVGWVNINLRPSYSQGSKTIGFEIVEQLGWRAPDNVIYPVATGLSFWQVHNGLREFYQFGIIDGLNTRMHAVQPTGCSPFVDGWRRYLETGEFKIIPVKDPHSVAETLCAGDPKNAEQAFETLKQSKGAAWAVTDEEIIEGANLISEHTGWNTGYVGGAVVAAAKKIPGSQKRNGEFVLVLTDAWHKGSKPVNGGKTGKVIHVEFDKKVITRTLESILRGQI